MIGDILKDGQVSNDFKRDFRTILDEGYTDKYPGESKQRKRKALRASIVAKWKYPNYKKIKGKVPSMILAPLTFNELNRLTVYVYRFAGFASAPVTFAAFARFSLPCGVIFSMLEMYVPEIPCKVMNWSGGCIFYGIVHSID